jgi:hypothetical protein
MQCAPPVTGPLGGFYRLGRRFFFASASVPFAATRVISSLASAFSMATWRASSGTDGIVLDPEQLLIDLYDGPDGPLDFNPDAVGAGANFLGELRFEQVVVELDDDQCALRLLSSRSAFPQLRLRVRAFVGPVF